MMSSVLISGSRTPISEFYKESADHIWRPLPVILLSQSSAALPRIADHLDESQRNVRAAYSLLFSTEDLLFARPDGRTFRVSLALDHPISTSPCIAQTRG
jgi:hypothetical protein